MPKMFNLDLDAERIREASCAFLVVDQDQVPKVAERLDGSAEIAAHMGYKTCLGEIEGEPVLVTSTGIGGPAVSIAVHELASLGVRTIIGLGTCGAIQDPICEGDIVLATGGVRLDGASKDYAPIAYPAVPNFRVASALVDALNALEKRYHIGLVASTDTFYPGQERYDEVGKHVIDGLRGSLQEWKRLGVLAFDMETTALLVVARTFGVRAASMRGVLINRARSQHVTQEHTDKVRADAAEVAVRAMRIFLKQSADKKNRGLTGDDL